MKERIPKLDADNPLGLLFSLAVCSKEKVAPAREFDLPLLFASEPFAVEIDVRSKLRAHGECAPFRRYAAELREPVEFFSTARNAYSKDHLVSMAWSLRGGFFLFRVDKKFIFNEVNH